MGRRSDAEIRRARLAALGRFTRILIWRVVLRYGCVGAARLAIRYWRRCLPIYWGLVAYSVAAVAGVLDVTPILVGLVAIIAAGIAAAWPATSCWIRAYRIGTVGFLGLWATIATIAGYPMPSKAVPMLVWPTMLLGWPWWWRLSGIIPDGQRAPVDKKLTEQWAARWDERIVAEIAKKTKIVAARRPRPHVVEADLHLSGGKIADVVKLGPNIETALELDEGAIGFCRTGKASRLTMSIVEQSYIKKPIPYQGSTYSGGRFTVAVYADGSTATWVHRRPKSGCAHGLVVGSTEGGKSRTLGVIIAELLESGCMVVVGDPQGGQSLPAWRDAVGEYHDSPEAVAELLARTYAEVMARSKLLAKHGIDHYDPDDPRIIALGLKPLAIVCDEIQLVLDPKTPAGRTATTNAQKIANLGRKTGVSLILATQLPQIPSLGNSYILRDALISGNCLILRLSNKGSGPTVLSADFVGDPFAIPPEIEVEGEMKTTAGWCYLRNAGRVGMLARVPLLDEQRTAARAPRIAVQWIAEPEAASEIDKSDPATSTVVAEVEDLIAMFGGSATPAKPRGENEAQPAQPAPKASNRSADDARKWIIDCLREAPQSVKSLLSRSDCPVSQSQLYAHINYLSDKDLIEKSGNNWRVT